MKRMQRFVIFQYTNNSERQEYGIVTKNRSRAKKRIASAENVVSIKIFAQIAVTVPHPFSRAGGKCRR